jgi:cytochrome c-type biogenesis protein
VTYVPRARGLLVLLAFLLLSVTLGGLLWLAATPTLAVSAALAYAAGLSMIVLPCTLPLVFIVVPLSLQGSSGRGLLTALLFGLGLTITISLYAAFVAGVGQFIGVPRISRVLWSVAGVAAVVFALGQLKLIRVELPAFSGTPGLVARRGGLLRPFFFGLFLGNIGVACPNPAFYILMVYIAGTGSVVQGLALGAVHGLGRVVPLLLLSVLAILGVNAVPGMLRRQGAIEKFTGWGLLVIGALLLTVGLFGMSWWDVALPHLLLDWLSSPLLGERLAELPAEAHLHAPTGFESYAPWLAVGIIVLGLLWYDYKRWRDAAN